MKMKKHYEAPEFELIRFMSEDVLSESGDPTGNGNEGTPGDEEEM